ncbi:hypothetical protein F4777DRAFT_570896 [Nemania sp. FL0916]|nr:hypothetical protein F4777DRAFT_570896 [Nemania sp. FL0916]
MKLHSFLLPALAGIAAADPALQHAEAYMLRHTKQSTTSNPPSIPHSLASAILLQRLSSRDQPAALGQIPQSLEEDDAIAYINEFATPARPLFESESAEADVNEPKQLVVTFSGITAKQYKQLKSAIPRVPLAFTARGLGRLPTEHTSSCAFVYASNPKEPACWNGKTQYLHYDMTQKSDIIQQLSLNLASLKSYANQGLMETTIVFLDGFSSSSSSDELRRRQLQIQKNKVTSETATPQDTTFVSSTHKSSSSNNGNKVHDAFASRPVPVPSCFASQSACENGTSACSGHGVCIDKWSKAATDKACFFCHCATTFEKDARGRNQTFHWGGATCQKRDISTPFWLFAGVTIALVGTIAFSIGLLFSVGEEKLPGVIGAGVSRSK